MLLSTPVKKMVFSPLIIVLTTMARKGRLPGLGPSVSRLDLFYSACITLRKKRWESNKVKNFMVIKIKIAA